MTPRLFFWHSPLASANQPSLYLFQVEKTSAFLSLSLATFLFDSTQPLRIPIIKIYRVEFYKYICKILLGLDNIFLSIDPFFFLSFFKITCM